MPLNTAHMAIGVIRANVPPTTLARTTYCAAVGERPDGTRMVLIAEAGAQASGINAPLIGLIEAALPAVTVNQVTIPTAIVIPCANTIAGAGYFHMNDAEQQAIRTFLDGADSSFNGFTLKAVVATREICQGCRAMLGRNGFIFPSPDNVSATHP